MCGGSVAAAMVIREQAQQCVIVLWSQMGGQNYFRRAGLSLPWGEPGMRVMLLTAGVLGARHAHDLGGMAKRGDRRGGPRGALVTQRMRPMLQNAGMPCAASFNLVPWCTIGDLQSLA